MKRENLLHEKDEFVRLWHRATEAQKTLGRLPESWSVLYFDAIDISLPGFFELVRMLLRLEGGTDFAVLALDPDPFDYFFYHFKKYPAFVVRKEHSIEEYYSFLHADPGDSPADALAYNAQEYAILPVSGSWYAFGNRPSEVGRLCASKEIIEFSRQHYPYFFEREDDLKPG
jgi:hypothetical protein